MNTPILLHSSQEGSPELPPLVILHGLFGSSTNWRSISRALLARFHVISLDLRNHGQSPWSEMMDYDMMARDVAETLTHRKIHSPVVVGHSMGGKTAMTLALMRLIPLKALIVADIAPVPYFHDHDDLVTAMEQVELGTVARRQEAEERLALHVTDPAVRQFLLQNLIRRDGRFAWRINLLAIRRSLPELIGWKHEGITDVNSLFLHGENSEYLTGSGRAAIRRSFPNATIVGIAGAGHWLHFEKPEEFIRSVLNFCNSSTDR